MYDYSLQMMENYGNVSTFSYLHPNTAHEASGTVISTLDLDTSEFLRTAMSAHPDNLVVFLMGDHGMRYGAWFTQINGSHEHRLPALFLITPTHLLNSLPNSRATLTANTRRLISKYDLHTTLVTLADRNLTGKSEKYMENVCGTSQKYRSVSLFLEEIDRNRTCEDVNIPSFWCSCIQFTEEIVTSKHIKMTNEGLAHINAKIHTPNGPGFGICRLLTLSSLLSVSYQQDKSQSYYKVEFTVQESRYAHFEMLLLISATRLRTRTRDGFGSSPFFLDSASWLKVMYVARLDAYAGVCKDLSSSFNLDPVVCICDSMENVNSHYPMIVDRTLAGYSPVMAVNSTCAEACETARMDCDAFGQSLLNECFVMYKYGACDRCFVKDYSHLIYTEKKKTCVTSLSYQAQCQDSDSTTRYCPCRLRSSV